MSELADLAEEMRRLGVSEASFADGRPTRIVLGRLPSEPEAHAAESVEDERGRRDRTLFGASR